ncbi:MAG: hypothetical protein P1U57_11350, partial [Oleibacter sp.]|nr:hypothetical protein [Thalassolituus sp.]
MNIIIVSKRHDESRTLQLSSSFKHLILGILFALPMAMGFVGYWIAERVSGELALGNDATKAWQNDLDQQRQELENLKLQKDRDISSL